MLKQGQPKFSLFLFFNSDSRRPSRVGKRCPVTSLQDGQVCGAATPQERAPGVRPEGNRLFLHLGARRQCPLPHPRTAPGGASQGPTICGVGVLRAPVSPGHARLASGCSPAPRPQDSKPRSPGPGAGRSHVKCPAWGTLGGGSGRLGEVDFRQAPPMQGT